MDSWNSKYEPKKLSEVAGQTNALLDVNRFIETFPKVKKKALLIHGPTGVGKTSIVKAIASQNNYELVELNASDIRNKDAIESVLGTAAKQHSLFGSSKLILIDEIDAISGVRDRGASQAVAKIIEETNFPIIMTANDAYSSKLKSLRKHCTLVELKSVPLTSIFNKLVSICKNESIDYEADALKKLASSCSGDLRAAINDLQMISQGAKKITLKDVTLWDREIEESIFNTLKIIFKSYDTRSALYTADHMLENLDTLTLWLDQSIPVEYQKPIEINKAYQNLSHADIFMSRIRKWQHWRFLVYAKYLTIVGVQHAKETTNPRFIVHKRPELLLKLFMRASKRKKIRALAKSAGPKLHASSRQLTKSFFPYLEFIRTRNQEYAEELENSLF
jgi:replication factor C large subunit